MSGQRFDSPLTFTATPNEEDDDLQIICVVSSHSNSEESSKPVDSDPEEHREVVVAGEKKATKKRWRLILLLLLLLLLLIIAISVGVSKKRTNNRSKSAIDDHSSSGAPSIPVVNTPAPTPRAMVPLLPHLPTKGPTASPATIVTDEPTQGPTESPATIVTDELTPEPTDAPQMDPVSELSVTLSPSALQSLEESTGGTLNNEGASDPPDRTCGMQTPGTLIVDGGELERAPDVATIEALIEALGGSTATKSLVLIPSAGAELDFDEEEEYKRLWTEDIGFDENEFTILHPESADSDYTGVEDSEEAGTQAFVSPLQTADVMFMRGGRQWRLVDAFKYTKLMGEMFDLLERGGVIAGTSAGATSQGFFMPRGDPDGSGIMIAERDWHRYGFGFLPGVAFDVHVDARDRWDDLYEVLSLHPELLGIGISEFTAIVVQGRYFQVVGERGISNSRVAVYSCSSSETCNVDDSPYQTLVAGEWFDLCNRVKVDEPSPESRQITKPRSLSLPYLFTDDYRLGGAFFSCSGRPCDWISSPIDTKEISEANIFARIQSDGNMEQSDFVRVSYRLQTDPPSGIFGDWADSKVFYGSWIEAITLNGGLSSDGTFQAPISVGNVGMMQLRIEAQTSSEENETYVVRDLTIYR